MPEALTGIGEWLAPSLPNQALAINRLSACEATARVIHSARTTATKPPPGAMETLRGVDRAVKPPQVCRHDARPSQGGAAAPLTLGSVVEPLRGISLHIIVTGSARPSRR